MSRLLNVHHLVRRWSEINNNWGQSLHGVLKLHADFTFRVYIGLQSIQVIHWQWLVMQHLCSWILSACAQSRIERAILSNTRFYWMHPIRYEIPSVARVRRKSGKKLADKKLIPSKVWTWPDKTELRRKADQSNCKSGLTLSVNQPLFWALQGIGSEVWSKPTCPFGPKTLPWIWTAPPGAGTWISWGAGAFCQNKY